MRKSKKVLAVVLSTVMAMTMLVGCGSKTNNNSSKETTGKGVKTESNRDEYTIGIGQFAQHGSLDNCREGFLAGLKEEGIEEGKNLTIKYDNANTDTGTAAQIATNYVANKVDLICGIATPMAQSAYGAARDAGIPVIFTAVTDPILAELAKEDGTPVGEITGTSDKLPVKQQLEMIREILPDAKKIGIMYTTSEVNSESAIADYEAAAAEYGFEIVRGAIATATDIPLVADDILGKVDCLTNITDNTVVSGLPTIIAKANAKNIPVFGSEIEQVKIGCLAAVGLDYFDLGKQTGVMAAKVLKGEKKASEINFEIIDEGRFYGNTAVAEQLGITIQAELTDKAVEMFSTIEEATE